MTLSYIPDESLEDFLSDLSDELDSLPEDTLWAVWEGDEVYSFASVSDPDLFLLNLGFDEEDLPPLTLHFTFSPDCIEFSSSGNPQLLQRATLRPLGPEISEHLMEHPASAFDGSTALASLSLDQQDRNVAYHFILGIDPMHHPLASDRDFLAHALIMLAPSSQSEWDRAALAAGLAELPEEEVSSLVDALDTRFSLFFAPDPSEPAGPASAVAAALEALLTTDPTHRPSLLAVIQQPWECPLTKMVVAHSALVGEGNEELSTEEVVQVIGLYLSSPDEEYLDARRALRTLATALPGLSPTQRKSLAELWADSDPEERNANNLLNRARLV